MSRYRYSFFGFNRGAKRNCAMLLVALWAVFSVSEVLAGCCDPHGGRFQRSTESFAHAHAAAAAAAHADHGEVDGPQQGDSREPACPTAADEAAPRAGSQTALSNGAASQEFLAAPARSAWPEATVRPWDERDRIRLSLAPRGPIYLRLQRFLI